eukprot:461213-Amphidinium_carterae.1
MSTERLRQDRDSSTTKLYCARGARLDRSATRGHCVGQFSPRDGAPQIRARLPPGCGLAVDLLH